MGDKRVAPRRPVRTDPMQELLRTLPDDIADCAAHGLPVVFITGSEPPDHVRKLMDTLGVRIEVKPVPVRSSPRSAVNKQVRVGEGTGGQIVVLGAWCPTCKRESMPNRHGYCSFCGTRILDEDSLSARAMRDQIDADKIRPVEESHAPEPLVTAGDDGGGVDPEAVGTAAGTEGPAAVGSSDAPVDGTNTATKRQSWSTSRRWTRDKIIAAIKAFGREHDRPPTADEWRHVGATTPNYSAVVTHCGSWADAIEAAGFPRPRRGGHRPSSSPPSSEVPKQEEAPVEITPYREEGAARSIAAGAGASESPPAPAADTHVAQALILAARAFADTLERGLAEPEAA